MTKPFRLNRRALLRGAGGVAIALPWLEAMVSGRSAHAADEPARRFLAVYNPGGTILDHWRPTGDENSFTLSPILAPFEPVKSKLVVLDGIDMTSATFSGEQDQSGMIAWLTGTEQMGAGTWAKGPSLDQVLATRLGGSHSLPSLSMAVRWGTGKSHGQPHPINIVNYADDDAYAPITPRLDPQELWTQLFGSVPPSSLDWDRSMLDQVMARYTALANRLGAADRARLEAHLERLRELERKLGQIVRCSAPERVDTPGYDPASGLNADNNGTVRDLLTDGMIPVVGRFMTDMMVMAFACDLTAVGTLQWSDCEAKHTFPWLGLPEHHHFYMNDGGFQPIEIEKIATWYSEQHSYLLQAMASVDMGGHTLLDESIVFFGSNLQDPSNHSKANMPFLLAGNGGGLRTGRFLQFAHPSHNDLLVRIANLFGDPRTTFGDPDYCTGALAGV
jgi:hypothetical protein